MYISFLPKRFTLSGPHLIILVPSILFSTINYEPHILHSDQSHQQINNPTDSNREINILANQHSQKYQISDRNSSENQQSARFSRESMAILYVLSRKVVLTSTCVLSIAMALKKSLPAITNFTLSELPLLYNFAISCLEPPYLYLFINFIIVTIVASSKLQNGDSTEFVSSPELVSSLVSSNLRPDILAAEVYDVNVYGGDIVSEAKIKEEVVEMRIVKQDSVELSKSSVKPPASARFGHRKSVNSTSEGTTLSHAGKSLRVTKPKKQDTLESTWKTITEGRPMPLTRHLRKSDTWEARNSPPQQDSTTNTQHKMKKSETFQDGTIDNYQSLGPGKSLRKEPSLNQDELNRRVEAFIMKVNEDMRLQRQESLDQYHEMIKRGAI